MLLHVLLEMYKLKIKVLKTCNMHFFKCSMISLEYVNLLLIMDMARDAGMALTHQRTYSI